MTDNKWIEVSERLPEEHVEVLAYCEGLIEMVRRVPKSVDKSGWKIAYFSVSDYGDLKKITHWRELPSPPKEE